MLERMYLRYGEKGLHRRARWKRPRARSPASRTARSKFSGEYAYGYLRTETGIHRLVRKSPFDSNARRHTSFTSVFVSRGRRFDRDRDQPADLRIDTSPRLRRGRPAHQQDRLGGAHHPRAHRHRRAVPERPQPAQEQGRGMSMLKARLYEPSCASASPSSRSWKTPRATSAGATRSAATCSTSRASRTCAPTTRSATPGRARRRPTTSSAPARQGVRGPTGVAARATTRRSLLRLNRLARRQQDPMTKCPSGRRLACARRARCRRLHHAVPRHRDRGADALLVLREIAARPTFAMRLRRAYASPISTRSS